MLRSRCTRYIVAFLLLAGCSKKSSEGKFETQDEGKAATAEPPTSAPSDGQSFKAGMQIICESVNEAGVGLAPSERQQAVATYIDAKVENEQVRELFAIMGDVPPSQRSGMMKAAATKAGLSACAIAEQ